MRRTLTVALCAIIAVAALAGVATAATSAKLARGQGAFSDVELRVGKTTPLSILLHLDGFVFEAPRRRGAGGDTGTHEVGHIVLPLTLQTRVTDCAGRTTQIRHYEAQVWPDVAAVVQRVTATISRRNGDPLTVDVNGLTYASGTATRLVFSC